MKVNKKDVLNNKNKKSISAPFFNSLVSRIFSMPTFITAIIFWLISLFGSQILYANAIQRTKFFTGTQKLIQDATAVLLILAPIITILAVGYFFIRKGSADEMDYKKWHTRITTAIVCCIGVITASILINLVIGYYN